MYRTSNAQIAERPAIWLLMQTSIDAIRHVTETFLGRSSSSECLIKTGVMFNLRHVCQDGTRARSRRRLLHAALAPNSWASEIYGML